MLAIFNIIPKFENKFLSKLEFDFKMLFSQNYIINLGYNF